MITVLELIVVCVVGAFAAGVALGLICLVVSAARISAEDRVALQRKAPLLYEEPTGSMTRSARRLLTGTRQRVP